jgi:hypothetical protein
MKQDKTTPTNPSLSLAIWEYSHKIERSKFKKLIVKKALRLTDLESKDLMTLADTEAKSISKQIEYLTEELNILYGFKIFSDHLETAYLESSQQILNAYQSQSGILVWELKELYKSYSFLQEQLESTIENLSFMTDLALKQTEQIILLKKKP